MAEPQPIITNSENADGTLSGTVVAARYYVREVLGKGAMSEVYRAEDARLKRNVALKRLAAGLRSDPNYRRRLREEAERVAGFSDSHIAAVYDYVEEGDEVFLVMELVEGQTLRDRLREPVSLADFFRIATDCAEGLATAHERGIIHCDIKPANIMLMKNGRVKILDFGVAKYMRSAQESTIDRSAGMRGTPAYMSPEVLVEKSADTRSDIFSLGIVLYECLTRKHPFLDRSFVATTDRIRNETPASIRSLNPEAPEPVEAIVNACLAKDPAKRPQSAGELLEQLRFVQGGSTGTRPLPLLRHYAERGTRPWLRLGLVALAVIVVALAVSQWWPRAWWPRGRVLPERGWALIADLESSGQDAIPVKGVREGLTIALQQSPYVNVFPRARLYDALRRMKRDEGSRIDEALGREICRRESVHVLLTGTVEHVGQAFQLTVRGVDPASGNLLFAEQERFERREQFFDRMDRLARAVRKDLGESLTGIEKNSRPLAKVTTRSLDALQLYSEAIDYSAQGKLEAVPALLNAALKFDPDFAMAHRLMARAYLTEGNIPKEIEELRRAYELRAGVTDREQRMIEADYYTATDQYEKQVESLVTLASLYPDDSEAHRDLGLAYYSVGRLTDAIGETRTVLKLDPHAAQAYSFLVLLLARSNRDQEAIEVYGEALRRGMQTPQLDWAYGLALLGKGEVSTARTVFGKLQGAGYGWMGQVYLARTALYEGKFAEGERILAAQLRADLQAENASAILLDRYLLASTLATEGKAGMVRQEVDAMLAHEMEGAAQAEDLRRAGALAVQVGDMKSARLALKRLGDLSGSAPNALNRSRYDNLAGEIELSGGSAEKAVELFGTSLGARALPASHAGLARAYAKLGKWSEAAAEWNKVLELKGEILQDYFPLEWEIAYLELARSQRGLRQLGDAKSNYEQFLHLWRDADSLSLQQDALREYDEIAHQ